MKYLDAEEILLIHHQLIENYGGIHGTRDINCIKSAAIAPAQYVFGKEQYTTVYEKAAVYARNIIIDHPFNDGNKRTGITCAAMFLNSNGINLIVKRSELEKFTVRIAIERLPIEKIANWIKNHSAHNTLN